MNRQYLLHSGTKGMKWHERHYQYEDGTYTPEGKERYFGTKGKPPTNPPPSIKSRAKGSIQAKPSQNEKPKPKVLLRNNGQITREGYKKYKQILESQGIKEERPRFYKDFWINPKTAVDESGLKIGQSKDVIKKGSTLHRIADDNDVVDDRRKYVSLLPGDTLQYKKAYKDLGMEDPSHALDIKLEAIKDITVAKGKDVAKYILDKYGDKTVKDNYRLLNKTENAYDIDPYSLTDKNDQEFVVGLMESVHRAERLVFNFFHENMYKDLERSKDILDHYKDLGYDAIVDAQDMGYADYPLILLNPKESVAYKSAESLYLRKLIKNKKMLENLSSNIEIAIEQMKDQGLTLDDGKLPDDAKKKLIEDLVLEVENALAQSGKPL